MFQDPVESIKHCRLVHFTLVLACAAVLAGLFTMLQGNILTNKLDALLHQQLTRAESESLQIAISESDFDIDIESIRRQISSQDRLINEIEILNEQAKLPKSKGEITVLSVNISLTFWPAIIIVLFQLYFYSHIKRFKSGFSKYPAPWIVLYDDNLSARLSSLSIVILPMFTTFLLVVTNAHNSWIYMQRFSDIGITMSPTSVMAMEFLVSLIGLCLSASIAMKTIPLLNNLRGLFIPDISANVQLQPDKSSKEDAVNGAPS